MLDEITDVVCRQYKYCLCGCSATGARCQFPNLCPQNNCVNGECEMIDNNGQCMMHCVCNTGWKGVNCDQSDDPCESEPCENGGTCVRDKQTGAYECRCVKGYWAVYFLEKSTSKISQGKKSKKFCSRKPHRKTSPKLLTTSQSRLKLQKPHHPIPILLTLVQNIIINFRSLLPSHHPVTQPIHAFKAIRA